MPDVVHELIATEAALVKLGTRAITIHEVEQLPRNAHVTLRNPRDEHGTRRLMIGRTDGGRVLTFGDRADRRADNMADRHRLELDGR